MSFGEIVGQDRAVEILTGALRGGQLHHAYLFGGPEGVGKELTARTLAMAANCERAEGDACGECGPCRRIAGRSHPDIFFVLPEAEQVARGWAGRSDFEGTPSREIRIAQVRHLQDRLALKALEARRKVAIISRAEAMNVQAQNALLKTLEEPPDQTTLILVTSAPHALLPTIRSRCLSLRFGPLPLEVLAERVAALKKTDRETALLCARLAEGSLSAALALDPEALKRRREFVERVEGLGAGAAREALRLAAEFGADRGTAEIHLDLLSAWYRDVALVASAGVTGALAHGDLAPLAARAAARHGAVEALRRVDLSGATRASLRGNASPRLQMEQLFLRFLFPDA